MEVQSILDAKAGIGGRSALPAGAKARCGCLRTSTASPPAYSPFAALLVPDGIAYGNGVIYANLILVSAGTTTGLNATGRARGEIGERALI
jgi:hypothetical protein